MPMSQKHRDAIRDGQRRRWRQIHEAIDSHAQLPKKKKTKKK